MKKLISYIAFAAALNAVGITFYLDTLRMPKAACQLPRLLIVLVVVLSLLMIAEQFWKMRQGPEVVKKKDGLRAAVGNDAGDDGLSLADKRGRLIRIVFFVAALSAYILTINSLGYFITTPLFLLGTPGFLRSTRLSMAMVIAVGFSGFVYLLFVQFLNLPVPMGLLAFE